MRDEFTTVCDRCHQRAFFTEPTPCRMSYPESCPTCHQRTEEYVRCPGTHRMIDRSELAPQFTRYYGSDARIKVRMSYGDVLTGTVGRSTGWKPIYLLMRRSDSISSSDTLGPDDRIIAVKHGSRYVPVAA